ncbi:MAG: DUF4417 domain-containing protein [Planctomycetia bacterium]|nr:DUF4417 domain-containing protein [Planctomycetia bacterium]
MINLRRKGCTDIWNAALCEGATFCEDDIPFCPTTAKALPTAIITWDNAVCLYNKVIRCKNDWFRHNAFVCFYIDDHKFDGGNGVWKNPQRALKILRHFAGVITPDFSTYQDFPDPIKRTATYRMRTLGYWFGKNGIAVINNVRWGTPETYSYCFSGVPEKSIVAVSTVGGSPRKLRNRSRFENGLAEMVRKLSPHTILVYGSAKYSCFEKLKEQGIVIRSYPSKMAQAFERRKNEQR